MISWKRTLMTSCVRCPDFVLLFVLVAHKYILCLTHRSWPWGVAFPSFWGCASYSYKYSLLLALSGSLVDIFVFTVGGSLRSCSYSAPCQGCFSPSLPKLTPALWPKQLNILKASARPKLWPHPWRSCVACCRTDWEQTNENRIKLMTMTWTK